MRIVAGTARGRPLIAPKGLHTRPTLDRIKESLFGILQLSVPGARVLDLFAGSGNLGLEALSRGAAYAVFNDNVRECCDIIRKNIETLGFGERCTVMQAYAEQAIARLTGGSPFDIVFLDPPYEQGAQQALLALFEASLVAQGGIVITEHAWDKPPLAQPGLVQLADIRKYGDTGLSFFEADDA